MAKLYGQLEKAQIENLGADPAGVGLSTGRIWFRTDLSTLKIYNGAASKTFTTSGDIVNADINASAAIAGTKISPDFGSQTVQTTGTITTSGIVQAGSNRVKVLGAVENLGLSYSAGILTFCQADQSALSASAPAFIGISSASINGKIVVLKLTANATLKDAASGASDISTSGRFDVSAGIAWGQARPFYLYAANLDDTDGNLALFISPCPNMSTVGFGDANSLGYKTVAPASPSRTSCIFLLSSSPAAYAGKPCVLIGGVTMTMNASNDWTIALSTAAGGALNQGICRTPHVGRLFVMPKSQMGANSGSFLGSVGTPPSWATMIEATSNYVYEIGLNGKIKVEFTTREMGNCTNGVGGQSFFLALPFATGEYSNSAVGYTAVGAYKATGASPTSGILCGGITLESKALTLYLADCATALANTTFSNSADDFDVKFEYRSF